MTERSHSQKMLFFLYASAFATGSSFCFFLFECCLKNCHPRPRACQPAPQPVLPPFKPKSTENQDPTGGAPGFVIPKSDRWVLELGGEAQWRSLAIPEIVGIRQPPTIKSQPLYRFIINLKHGEKLSRGHCLLAVRAQFLPTEADCLF